MIPPDEFLISFIRPVLSRLADADKRLASRAAEVLLLGTAIQESGLRHMTQISGGPALGFWQIEPATAEDIYERYLKTMRTDLLGAVRTFVYDGVDFEVQLRGNPMLGCALARIKFWQIESPLPEATDIDGMGGYWKNWYNTAAGGGSAPEWALKYRKYVV